MALTGIKNRTTPVVQNEVSKPDVPTDSPTEAPVQPKGLFGEIRERFQKDVAAIGLTAYAPLAKPPVLKRPVVMIPGLTLHASSYDNLARNLATEKKNGPVAVYVAATRQFHLGGVSGRAMSPAELKNTKIFQLEYKDPKAAPTEKAPQLDEMLKGLAQVTGRSDVDIVTHSAGGDDFRQYLDTRTSRDIQIGKLVTIGAVTHGTFMGNLGSKLGALIGVKPAADELGYRDPLVEHLDKVWPDALAQISEGVTSIVITGAPTVAEDGSIEDGDGFEPEKEAAITGAKVIVLRGADPTPLAHLREVGYSGTVDKVQDALGG